MYTCGLTVYARGHIGNFRTFVSLDVLRRALRYQEGYAMRHVMNFTDVDDKTINASQQAGVPLREYTDRYVAAFLEDAAAMGLEPVEENPRATDEAEPARDGRHDQGARGARPHLRVRRIDLLPDRDAARTTASWRGSITTACRPARAWTPTPTPSRTRATSCCGRRPSRASRRGTTAAAPAGPAGTSSARRWRCGCSGEPPIDIHGGGIDLIFPHHENEIAQAEGATGQPFSRFWVHVEFLNLDNEKMSKSLGNVFTVRDILDKGYRASALRYLLISVHYRKQLTFNWDVLAQAEAAVTRLADFLARVDGVTRRARARRRSPTRVGRGARRSSARCHRRRPQRARRRSA